MYGSAAYLLLLVVPVLVAADDVYHVVPHEYAVCPHSATCRTLQYYVDHQDHYFVLVYRINAYSGHNTTHTLKLKARPIFLFHS